MKVAIITEGEGEWAALPELLPQFRTRSSVEFIQIMRVRAQPDGPVEKLARACKPAFQICEAKGVDRVVIVLDREQQPEPPGDIALRIQTAIRTIFHAAPFEIRVVIKDRAFENWVIADLSALRAQRARYKVSTAMANAVAPNKADRTDALALLKSAAVGQDYHKIQDSRKTLAKADVARLAANSRSFRHLLHVIEDPDYCTQCKVPA